MANIRHNFMIKSSSDIVYQAIATENGIKGWWTFQTQAKPELGHINEQRFGEEYFNKMKVTRLDLNKCVEWECIDGELEWIGTNLSFEIQEKNDQVLLKFSHENWPAESEFFGFCSYHWGRYLSSLKSLCETGEGQPFSG